ncbi:hypothetical protein BDK51DRAFT_44297 [Blyttiomyces helicus]|uniref:Uncharacterized protein n=1 Tax=Blyttiomyces helicus TaxID=388810 RepID=A0A4P9VY80_9FUNG|nr:hypothetical protein BDK51DRAFT_44297 [Blyttiomyces helicus]|eukprot:RKO84719.1 hypothetical protein BDK51DRAFT_44297 [Blyttiomyces helicus]
MDKDRRRAPGTPPPSLLPRPRQQVAHSSRPSSALALASAGDLPRTLPPPQPHQHPSLTDTLKPVRPSLVASHAAHLLRVNAQPTDAPSGRIRVARPAAAALPHSASASEVDRGGAAESGDELNVPAVDDLRLGAGTGSEGGRDVGRAGYRFIPPAAPKYYLCSFNHATGARTTNSGGETIGERMRLSKGSDSQWLFTVRLEMRRLMFGLLGAGPNGDGQLHRDPELV